MNKTKVTIVSLLALVGIGLGSFLFLNNPKAIFLKRMHDTTYATKLSQSYDMKFESAFFTFGLKGESHLNGDDMLFTLDSDGLPFDMPNVEVTKIKDDAYLNAEVFPIYMSTTSSYYGSNIDVTELEELTANKHVNLYDLMVETVGKETADELKKELKNPDKSTQEAVEKYFKDLPKDKFTNTGDDVHLDLTEKDLKDLFKILLVEAGKQNDDVKEQTKNFDSAFDGFAKQFDIKTFKLTYGKTLGDTNFTFVIKDESSDFGEFKFKFATKSIKSKKITKPTTVMTSDEIKSLFEKAQSSIEAQMTEDYEIVDTYTQEDVEDMRKFLTEDEDGFTEDDQKLIDDMQKYVTEG